MEPRSIPDNHRPYVLSIAGFDPSGGAGILADSKTFEAHQVIGLAVCTAITYQNEDQFTGVKWFSYEEIRQQMVTLLSKYSVDYAKIGLIENFEIMARIIDFLLQKNQHLKIIWDPILKTSTGYCFHKSISADFLKKISQRIYLITPNWQEIRQLYPHLPEKTAAQELSVDCHIFLKGGHYQDDIGRDYLFMKQQKTVFPAKYISSFPKHGSGCVLSAAITAYLANGDGLPRACSKAKEYVNRFLHSNRTLLGYHQQPE